MKRIFLTCIVVLCCIGFSQAQAVVGLGLGYGTEIEEPGILLDGEFFINEELSLSPDLIIYFVEDGPGVKRGFWEFNANVHYYFVPSGVAQVYGLAGLNLATATVDVEGFDKSSETELGLNLGIGANFDVGGKIKPFTEFKFTVSEFDQAVLLFGIKYAIR